ncbi:Kelch repeat-containing protein [Sphingomicrobium flavum]|uniref:Kelch repeat-containing protein n=1 Tax=Sphingomicrobium flavum TaxID=1229164 RepID=UPI0021ADF433|nr:hypothetical protein [Sphingomicrobium flavum]
MRTAIFLSLALAACTPASLPAPQPLAPMPVAHANNAVAMLGEGDDARFYSFLGLKAGKTHEDISKSAFSYGPAANAWSSLPDVPVAQGRLASIAVGLNGKIYLFGGYTVAPDGHEVSTPEVLAFDPVTNGYEQRAPMPTPVDDSVAFAYQDRYIYLVSGWHDVGNVQLVQVYDSVEDRWARATDFPGAPVFGHAGGIFGNRIVIADGVTSTPNPETGRRSFAMTDGAFIGTIDPADPTRIDWQPLPPHPGKPRYRMAATGHDRRILFAGGSVVAYNFNGEGYDGTPAPASAGVFAYDLATSTWVQLADKPAPSMDHRGLLFWQGRFHTLGGMDDQRRVIGDVIAFEVTP